jgi:hypothetical protein
MDKIHKLLCNAYPLQVSNLFLEARCDGFTNYGYTSFGNNQSEAFDFLKGGFYWIPEGRGVDQDRHEFFWEASYKAISYSNTVLDALERDGASYPANEVKPARAEARIARAYNHFMMLTMFTNMFNRGHETENMGIPYVKVPEDVMFKQYERGTVASTLAEIKTDLFDEINNIPNSSYYQSLGQEPKFHFTDQAAKAFAVRFCLFTQDYSGVINYANQLIGTPSVFTAPSGTNAIDGSPKIYVSTTDPAYIQASQLLFNMVAFANQPRSLYQPMFTNPENTSYYLMTEANTLAWRAFLGTYMVSYAYTQGVLSNIVGSNPTGNDFALPIYALANDESGFAVKYFEDFQLVDEVAGIGYVWSKVNLFRLEEALLARAEANTMLGNFQEAINDLNIYLQRKVRNWSNNSFLDKDKVVNYYNSQLSTAFVNNEFNQNAFNQAGNLLRLQQSLIMCIMDLRRAEFCYEGMRYFDILRWNIPVTHTRLTDNTEHTLYPDDDNRILQLPAAVVTSGLQYNPMIKFRDPWPELFGDEK